MAEVPSKMAKSVTTKKRKASAHTAAPVDKKSSRGPLNSFALERAFLNQDKKQNSGSQGTKTLKINATPNLTIQRNKRITKVDNDGFTHPAKTAKGNLLNTLTDASPITTNKFDPLSVDGGTVQFDSMETESQNPPTNSNDNNAAQSTAEKNNTQEVVKEKSYRPPPILIPGEAVSKTVTSIRIANIEQDSFVVTLSKGLHSVQATNQVSYETIKKTLKEASIQYYTYTPKGDRPKSVLLKGISDDFSPAQVAENLKSKNIPSVEILKVSELKFKGKDNNPGRHLIVQVTQKSSLKELFKIRNVLSLKARWERLRKNRVLQCLKCQRIGHTAANCEMEFRCVKCGESHIPGECPLNDETTREKFRCANCKKVGHPANYAGCEFIKFAKITNVGSIQSKNRKLDRRIEVLNRGINPQLSFASVASTSRENFPLLRQRHSQDVINFQQQSSSNSTSQLNNNKLQTRKLKIRVGSTNSERKSAPYLKKLGLWARVYIRT